MTKAVRYDEFGESRCCGSTRSTGQSPRCADPLYRRSVKVSMGAVFSIPYARMDNWYTG
ncbi:MAG: rRNA methyltransferase, partial [Nonomuraea muscovyensis]|nr:rRNA methyltransferase [Nonomuraea muscovyensis]